MTSNTKVDRTSLHFKLSTLVLVEVLSFTSVFTLRILFSLKFLVRTLCADQLNRLTVEIDGLCYVM